MPRRACNQTRWGFVERDAARSVLVVEVKDGSNDAWYAVVENLLQLRLARDSDAAKTVFERRRGVPGSPVRRVDAELVHAGVVLAPPAFYTHAGRKSRTVAVAQELVDRFAEECGVAVHLAVWDGEATIDPLAREVARPLGG